MTKQLTKSEKFALALASLEEVEFANKEAVVEFLLGEKELVEKRNAKRSASRKPTKAQLENQEFVARIVAFFESDEVEADKAYSSVEIAEAVGFEDFSAQKMSALMKKVIEEGVVVKHDKADSDKGKVGYSVVQEAESLQLEGSPL